MWNSSTYYNRPALVIWGNFTIAAYYNLASTDELFDGYIVYWCSLDSFKEHWLHHTLIIGTLVIYPLCDESLVFVAFIIWLLLLTLLSHEVCSAGVP